FPQVAKGLGVGKEAGVELGGGGGMYGEEGGAVGAGIRREFGGEGGGGEDFVEGGCAGVEAVVVVVAAVEIDFEAGEAGGAAEDERTVLVPEIGIGRIAEN